MTTKYRSYARDVTARIEWASEFPYEVIGEVTHESTIYPMYLITAKGVLHRHKKNVLISGGVHGGEPAGVYAVLDFMQNRARHYLDGFNFYAYPCINPWSFERHDWHLPDPNINRSFKKKATAKEASIIKQSLKKGPDNYLFTMDMHECGIKDEKGNVIYSIVPYGVVNGKKKELFDKMVLLPEDDFKTPDLMHLLRDLDKKNLIFCPEGKFPGSDASEMLKGKHIQVHTYKNPYEFFMWEICENKDIRVGRQVIEALKKKKMDICTWPEALGDRNSDGVIWYPEGAISDVYSDAATFDMFLRNNYTQQAFTTETPTHWSLDKRIDAHITSLEIALNAHFYRRY